MSEKPESESEIARRELESMFTEKLKKAYQMGFPAMIGINQGLMAVLGQTLTALLQSNVLQESQIEEIFSKAEQKIERVIDLEKAEAQTGKINTELLIGIAEQKKEGALEMVSTLHRIVFQKPIGDN